MVSALELSTRFFAHELIRMGRISRHTTVQKTLIKETTTFLSEESDDQQLFGLTSNDLTQIRPNYEAMVKGGSLRITDDGYAQGKPMTIETETETEINAIMVYRAISKRDLDTHN